jgi:hypothetical protein
MEAKMQFSKLVKRNPMGIRGIVSTGTIGLDCIASVAPRA